VSRRLDDLRELVGETRTTVEGFAVEAGKIEEFARAVGDDNPIHRDADAATNRGFDGIPAPLTFTRTSTFPRYRTRESVDLGFQPEYVLHGAHAYEYDRPLLAGDVLTGETTFADITEREGQRGGTMTFAEVETVYHDVADERVLAERATVIETDGAVEGGSGDSVADRDDESSDDASHSGASEATAVTAAEPTAPDPVTVGDFRVGDTAPEVRVGPLERQDFVRYAGASGDFNPIHYDEPYARAAGNPSVFGQGMFTAGVAAHAVADWFGLAAVRTFEVRFQSRVWPGDTIATTVEATDIESSGADERIECDVSVSRTDGEVVLTGQAAALLPSTA
jgi:peroxisomal enoyl-CoA hydratase 2